MNDNMNAQPQERLPIYGPPQRGTSLFWQGLLLFLALYLPSLPFSMWQVRGPVLDAGHRARLYGTMALLTLTCPIAVALIFQRTRLPAHAAGGRQERVLHWQRRLAIGLLMFWASLVVAQAGLDEVFARRFDRQVQPWAIEMLSGAPSRFVTTNHPGIRELKREFVPEFLGRVSGLRYAKDGVRGIRRVAPRGEDRWFFHGNEPCIVISYGGGHMPLHGYIVGDDSLKVWDGPVQNVRDGVYAFEFAN